MLDYCSLLHQLDSFQHSGPGKRTLSDRDSLASLSKAIHIHSVPLVRWKEKALLSFISIVYMIPLLFIAFWVPCKSLTIQYLVLRLYYRWQFSIDSHVICLNGWYTSLSSSDNHNHLNLTLGPPTWSISYLAFTETLWVRNHRSSLLPLSELPRQPHALLQHSEVMAPCLRQQWHVVWELSLPHSCCVMSALVSLTVLKEYLTQKFWLYQTLCLKGKLSTLHPTKILVLCKYRTVAFCLKFGYSVFPLPLTWSFSRPSPF